jgi:hypothetical protein
MPDWNRPTAVVDRLGFEARATAERGRIAEHG